MTELREDVIHQVRFGCLFEEAHAAVRSGKKAAHNLWRRDVWWTNEMNSDSQFEHWRGAAWIIAPADATEAEIDEAHRRWSSATLFRTGPLKPPATASADATEAEIDEAQRRREASLEEAEGAKEKTKAAFDQAARVAFEKASDFADRAATWSQSEVAPDHRGAQEQARLASEWVRIARDLDAARDLVDKWGGE